MLTTHTRTHTHVHRLLEEYQQHAGPVRSVAFLPDGSLLFSAAEDGHVCVYDCAHNYAPVKTLSGGFPSNT